MNSRTETANILVVDNDPLNLELVAGTLARAGFIATLAASGEEAMDRMNTEQFDAVVIDAETQPTSGIELLEQVRARFPSLPVILMTAPIEDVVGDGLLPRTLLGRQTIESFPLRPEGLACRRRNRFRTV